MGVSSLKSSHLAGIQRRIVLGTVGAFARFFTDLLNDTRVHNFKTLTDLVQSRPRDTALVTVSNHMSTLDDPLMWGVKGLPITDSRLTRWTLTAEDICFTNPLFSYLFRLGKCLPVRRGAGIYQPYMRDALEVINRGDWLHTFPEGKLSQAEEPLRRLKWGTASLIARASVRSIILPIAHSGFEKVMPETFIFGKRPLLPLPFKRVTIVVGEPIVFDVPTLRQTAEDIARSSAHKANCANLVGSRRACDITEGSSVRFGYARLQRPTETVVASETPLRWMLSHMSENLRCLLQELVVKAKHLNSLPR